MIMMLMMIMVADNEHARFKMKVLLSECHLASRCKVEAQGALCAGDLFGTKGGSSAKLLIDSCRPCEMIVHGHKMNQPRIHDAGNRRYGNRKRFVQ